MRLEESYLTARFAFLIQINICYEIKPVSFLHSNSFKRKEAILATLLVPRPTPTSGHKTVYGLTCDANILIVATARFWSLTDTFENVGLPSPTRITPTVSRPQTALPLPEGPRSLKGPSLGAQNVNAKRLVIIRRRRRRVLNKKEIFARAVSKLPGKPRGL